MKKNPAKGIIYSNENRIDSEDHITDLINKNNPVTPIQKTHDRKAYRLLWYSMSINVPCFITKKIIRSGGSIYEKIDIEFRMNSLSIISRGLINR